MYGNSVTQVGILHTFVDVCFELNRAVRLFTYKSSPETCPMLEYSMFERLPYRSQREALKKEGTLIARRQVKEYTILLYTLGHTFVEVWIGTEAEVVSSFKKSTDAIAVLEPYTEDVDIQHLLSLL